MNEILAAYKGKRVLVTGHTGFKGSWLCQMLKMAGAEVIGYALEPNVQPSLYELAFKLIHCWEWRLDKFMFVVVRHYFFDFFKPYYFQLFLRALILR